MSRALISHLWRTNRDQILRNAVVNCHARGLNSIVLLDEPGKRIRLFVATPEHDLFRNGPDALSTMSIAFHPHHCDIIMEVVRGNLMNRYLHIQENGSLRLKKYAYSSKLRGEQPGFALLGEVRGIGGRMRLLNVGAPVCEMRAAEIHTVVADRYCEPAWLIYEGAEDPQYKSVCYSNDFLEDADFSDMYRPMSALHVELAIHGILS